MEVGWNSFDNTHFISFLGHKRQIIVNPGIDYSFDVCFEGEVLGQVIWTPNKNSPYFVPA
jgi:hypothetical protein